MSSRIPHYHAQEATDAIRPMLGDYYNVDKSSYFGALWTAFTQCQWVEADPAKTARAVGHNNMHISMEISLIAISMSTAKRVG